MKKMQRAAKAAPGPCGPTSCLLPFVGIFVESPSGRQRGRREWAAYKWLSLSCCIAGLLAVDAPTASAQPAVPPLPQAEDAQELERNGERSRSFVFNIGLYRLKQTADDELAGIRFFPERNTPIHDYGVPHAFGSLNCEQCHVVNWPATSKSDLLSHPSERVFGEALTSSVAQVIAEPVLSTVEGRPAQLRLQGGEVDYFVSDGDGRFRLEKTKDQSGVEVQLLVRGAKEENDSLNVTVDPFEIRITTLDHRELIEGVDLPVGKPVFRTFEWDATLTCRPGQMNAFTLDSPRQGRILVVVRLQAPLVQHAGKQRVEVASQD